MRDLLHRARGGGDHAEVALGRGQLPFAAEIGFGLRRECAGRQHHGAIANHRDIFIVFSSTSWEPIVRRTGDRPLDAGVGGGSRRRGLERMGTFSIHGCRGIGYTFVSWLRGLCGQGRSRLAGVAQLVEQLIRNQQVVGSSPTAGSSFTNNSAVSWRGSLERWTSGSRGITPDRDPGARTAPK